MAMQQAGLQGMQLGPSGRPMFMPQRFQLTQRGEMPQGGRGLVVVGCEFAFWGFPFMGISLRDFKNLHFLLRWEGIMGDLFQPVSF